MPLPLYSTEDNRFTRNCSESGKPAILWKTRTVPAFHNYKSHFS